MAHIRMKKGVIDSKKIWLIKNCKVKNNNFAIDVRGFQEYIPSINNISVASNGTINVTFTCARNYSWGYGGWGVYLRPTFQLEKNYNLYIELDITIDDRGLPGINCDYLFKGTYYVQSANTKYENNNGVIDYYNINKESVSPNLFGCNRGVSSSSGYTRTVTIEAQIKNMYIEYVG